MGEGRGESNGGGGLLLRDFIKREKNVACVRTNAMHFSRTPPPPAFRNPVSAPRGAGGGEYFFSCIDISLLLLST